MSLVIWGGGEAGCALQGGFSHNSKFGNMRTWCAASLRSLLWLYF